MKETNNSIHDQVDLVDEKSSTPPSEINESQTGLTAETSLTSFPQITESQPSQDSKNYENSPSSSKTSDVKKYEEQSFFLVADDNEKSDISDVIRLKEIIHKDLATNVFGVFYSADINKFVGRLSNECNYTFVVCPHKNRNLIGRHSNGKGKTVIYPNMPISTNCHPKLLLIEHSDFIRVVIGTANMIEDHWASQKNCIYLQDFKKLKIQNQNLMDSLPIDLEKMFDALGLLPSDYEFLKHYDFSTFKGELVYSFPDNKYLKNDEDSNEISGTKCLQSKLYKMFGKEVLEKLEHVTWTYGTSSLSKITSKYANSFMESIYGKKGELNFKIAYPSVKQEELNEFINKQDSGPLFFKPNQFTVDNKPMFHKQIHCNKTILSHIKMLIASHSKDIKKWDWVYFGSHNLTYGAWGPLDDDDPKGRNFEMGVVFKHEDINMEIPIVYPAPKYDEDDMPFFTLRKFNPKITPVNRSSVSVLPENHLNQAVPQDDHVDASEPPHKKARNN